MSDKSWPVLDFIFGKDWKPKSSDPVLTQIAFPLEDNVGNAKQIRELELVKTWATVYRDNVSQFHYRITDISGFNMKTAETSVYDGVETPEAIETKVASFAVGSWIGALYRAITNLGDTVISAILGSLRGIVYLMAELADSLLYWTTGIRWGDIWPYIQSYIDLLWVLVSSITDLITAVTTALTQILDLFFALIDPLIYHATWMISTAITLITTTLSLVSGDYFGIGDIWTDYSMDEIFQLVFLLSIWNVFERCRKEQSLDPLISSATFVFDVTMFFMDLTFTILGFVIDLIFGIINLVPVVE
jgi:hypothetical protein